MSSAVSKNEQGDKCELQLDKFTITLDEEEGESQLHKPGECVLVGGLSCRDKRSYN